MANKNFTAEERLLRAIFGDTPENTEIVCVCGEEVLTFVDGIGYCKECVTELIKKWEKK